MGDLQATNNREKTAFDAAAEAYFASPANDKLEALLKESAGLIRHFAKLYGGGHLFDDLMQTGREGLLKAAANFSPEAGVSFATYAGHWILGEIRHYVRREARFYSPFCVAGLQAKINGAIDEALQKTGRAPSAAEIAEKLNLRDESVSAVLCSGLVEFSELDKHIHSAHYESFQLPVEDRIVLQQALAKLNKLQKKVVWLLFYYDLTQSEVAKRLGISQRQVSRIKEKSLGIMREEAVSGD